MLNVGIIGAGLIGGSILKAGKQNWADTQIGVFDADKKIRKEVKSHGAEWFDTVTELTHWSDLLFICVPFEEFPNVVNEINATVADRKRDSKLVITDVTSPKTHIVDLFEEMEHIAEHADVVFGHPMAGTEHSGFSSSFPELFKERTWVLFTDLHAGVESFLLVAEKVLELGSLVSVLSSKEHDIVVTKISHMPYMFAAANAILAANSPHPNLAYRLAAGSFADVTRVADSPTSLSVSMFSNNDDHAIPEIEEAIALLEKFKECVASGSMDHVEDFFGCAQQSRLAYHETKRHSPALEERVSRSQIVGECNRISRNGGVILSVRSNHKTAVIRYEPN